MTNNYIKVTTRAPTRVRGGFRGPPVRRTRDLPDGRTCALAPVQQWVFPFDDTCERSRAAALERVDTLLAQLGNAAGVRVTAWRYVREVPDVIGTSRIRAVAS